MNSAQLRKDRRAQKRALSKLHAERDELRRQVKDLEARNETLAATVRVFGTLSQEACSEGAPIQEVKMLQHLLAVVDRAIKCDSVLSGQPELKITPVQEKAIALARSIARTIHIAQQYSGGERAVMHNTKFDSALAGLGGSVGVGDAMNLGSLIHKHIDSMWMLQESKVRHEDQAEELLP